MKAKLKPLRLVVKNQKKESRDPMQGKKPIKIDHRTTIYVPANTTNKELQAIIKRYTKQK